MSQRPRYVSPSWELPALAAAIAVGALIGLAPLQEIAARVVGRAGIGNAVAVNVLLPLASIALAIIFPRVRSALIAGPLVVIGFALARLLLRDVRIWTWTLAFLADGIHPILLGAAIGCALLSAVAALCISPWRRVGLPPHEPSCLSCAHALSESPQAPRPARCPECGAAVPRR